MAKFQQQENDEAMDATSSKKKEETKHLESTIDAWNNSTTEHGATSSISILGYDNFRVLGKGGMGLVYQARQVQLNRQVAIKVMKPESVESSVARTRFLREAQATAALSHDHVIPLIDYGEHEGRPYLVMPLLQGETLETRLQRGPLSPEEVRRLGREAALGLAAVHQAGLIHRDIKPSNIWLEEHGNGWRVKLLDFGLARINEESNHLTVAGSLLGTPAYMSPEQADGMHVDARSDLFSLGAVLYHAATGTSPFQRESFSSTLHAVATFDPPNLMEICPSLPERQIDAIHQMLTKKTEDRPVNAGVIVEAFADHVTPGPTLQEASTSRVVTSKSKSLRGCTVSITISLAVFMGAIWFVQNTWLKINSRANSIDVLTEVKHANENTSPVASAVSQPAGLIKIKSLKVSHAVLISADETQEKGDIGEVSFAVKQGDRASISARLSRSGYAYLLAFAPDGKVELCWPQDESAPPPFAEELHFPSQGNRGNRYAFTDGAGLVVFTVVASSQPLPAYKEWSRGRTWNWKPTQGKLGQVWVDDGKQIQILTSQGASSSQRGKNEKSLAPTAFMEALNDTLLKQPGVESIRSVGFVVY